MDISEAWEILQKYFNQSELDFIHRKMDLVAQNMIPTEHWNTTLSF
ncbi:hypothetical protein [Butyrivibrio fibrisolvens]|nr:hypothetical protein [Butyrivibrio fibrisolvens]